jgi:hypothetical protein
LPTSAAGDLRGILDRYQVLFVHEAHLEGLEIEDLNIDQRPR